MQFDVFLPQMRLSFDQLVERARAAQAAGFHGMAGMDHLVPPFAEDQPMYEAMITNTWLAAHTDRLVLSSLVLCDSFRHPAVLAREAASLQHASGGRFELGIGWGSVPTEFDVFGVGSTEPRVRVQRLKETLEVVTALWSGEVVDYDGAHHHLQGAQQQPLPLGRLPIVIGGVGPKTLELVATYADWWNVHAGVLDKLDEMRPRAGKARLSIQKMVAYVPTEADRDQVTAAAMKRFGGRSPVIGTGPELVEHFAGWGERGIERVYAWFCDFAPPETLAGFGEEVVAQLA